MAKWGQASIDMSCPCHMLLPLRPLYPRHTLLPLRPLLSIWMSNFLRENLWVEIWIKTQQKRCDWKWRLKKWVAQRVGSYGQSVALSVAVSASKEGNAWQIGCKREC